jgi:hypothetical protein
MVLELICPRVWVSRVLELVDLASSKPGMPY